MLDWVLNAFRGSLVCSKSLHIRISSNSLVHTFSSKSDDILFLAPICLNLVFKYKIFKYQFQIRIQHLQIGWCSRSDEILISGPYLPKFRF